MTNALSCNKMMLHVYHVLYRLFLWYPLLIPNHLNLTVIKRDIQLLSRLLFCLTVSVNETLFRVFLYFVS